MTNDLWVLFLVIKKIYSYSVVLIKNTFESQHILKSITSPGWSVVNVYIFFVFFALPRPFNQA